jgi:hypothetical protein
MKNILLALTLVSLVGCGSAAEIAAALRETPVPAETSTSAPGIVWTVTPYPALPAKEATAQPTVVPPSARSMQKDYEKVAKGMTREEVLTVMGPFHERSEKTFCMNGKCEEYEYLKWLYDEGTIHITIQKNIATVTYTM